MIPPGPVARLVVADCLGYLRVSTEDQASEAKSSLGDQRAAIAALALRLRRAPPTILFEDPGVSGATAEDRPGFMALVRYCEQHPRPRQAPGYVLVLNDARWGRWPNAEEATYWRVRLERLGWRVRFAEGDETEDPIARNVLRAVLRPWLADAVVDKANRKLILTIRRVPAVGPLLHSCTAPGRDAQKQRARLTAQRVIALPPLRIRRTA